MPLRSRRSDVVRDRVDELAAGMRTDFMVARLVPWCVKCKRYLMGHSDMDKVRGCLSVVGCSVARRATSSPNIVVSVGCSDVASRLPITHACVACLRAWSARLCVCACVCVSVLTVSYQSLPLTRSPAVVCWCHR